MNHYQVNLTLGQQPTDCQVDNDKIESHYMHNNSLGVNLVKNLLHFDYIPDGHKTLFWLTKGSI